MSLVEYSAANLTAPYKNTVTLACIWAADVDATSDNTDLATVFAQCGSGDWITVFNDSLDATVYIALGASAGTIDPAARGAGVTVCWPIAPNTQQSMRVQEGRTFLHYITATGTSTIRVYRSSTAPDVQPSSAFKAAGVL